MRPPGPIGASPRPPATRRPPPAAREPQPPPPVPLSLRRRRHHCQPRRHRHRLGPQPRGEAPPAPSPRRCAPASLPGPRASLAPPLSAPAPPPAPPRHLLSRPPRASPLGLRPLPRRHSGARPLRTCVCLTAAPFSTLAGPLPASLCPSGSVEDKRSGSPGTVRFYPGTSVDVHWGDVFPHPFSASPDFLETPAAPPPPHRPRRLQHRSPPRSALPLPTVSPPPCPWQPRRRRTLAPDSSPSLGKRRDTHLEGDWDLGVGGGGILAWVGWGLWRRGHPPLPRRPVLFLTPKEKCKPGGCTTPRRAGGTPPAGGRTAEGARESLPRPSSPPCGVLPSRRLIVPRPPLQ